jgi:Domain of unknown function (DUF4124)
MFHVKQLLLVSLLSLAIFPAIAQKMYRCPSAGGGTTFSDTPCANGTGNEVNVKPSGGSGSDAGSAKTDPNSRGAMDKRNAEIIAMLSPECRRARDAFMTKARQRGGMEELMKDSNPISMAWEACELETREVVSKILTRDAAKAKADEAKRIEQEKIAVKKNECATKRQVLRDRQARLAQMSEKDRAAVGILEQNIADNCRDMP